MLIKLKADECRSDVGRSAFGISFRCSDEFEVLVSLTSLERPAMALLFGMICSWIVVLRKLAAWKHDRLKKNYEAADERFRAD